MKTKIYILFSASLIFIVATSGILSDDGKAGKTKSPGESSCMGCHSGNPENSGGGSISMTGIPSSGYVPGSTYHLQITVKQSGKALFGFGAEALKNADTTNAGIFVVTDALKTQLKSATVATKSRANMVHMLNGGASQDSAVFSFDWQAPSADSGIVTFYYAGIAADQSGSTSGDYVYYASTSASPNGISETGLPEISFSVFPNPGKEFFNVKFYNESDGTVNFKLNNIEGQTVYTFFSKKFSAGNFNENISLPESISAGNYFLILEKGGSRTVKKVTVIK